MSSWVSSVAGMKGNKEVTPKCNLVDWCVRSVNLHIGKLHGIVSILGVSASIVEID